MCRFRKRTHKVNMKFTLRDDNVDLNMIEKLNE